MLLSRCSYGVTLVLCCCSHGVIMVLLTVNFVCYDEAEKLGAVAAKFKGEVQFLFSFCVPFFLSVVRCLLTIYSHYHLTVFSVMFTTFIYLPSVLTPFFTY